MGLKELLQTKNEGSIVGKLECSKFNLADTLINMMEFMGMTNPSKVVRSSSKAISLSKKGDTYTLTLLNFQPPVKVSWSDSMTPEELNEFFNKVSTLGQKLAYVNKRNISNQEYMQFAVA